MEKSQYHDELLYGVISLQNETITLPFGARVDSFNSLNTRDSS